MSNHRPTWHQPCHFIFCLLAAVMTFHDAVAADGKAGGISYMRETNAAMGEQSPNLVLVNRNERRSYSLLEAARASLGPKATQPACADRLSPTQREQIQVLAKNEDSFVSPRLSHQLMLHQDALLEMRGCVREAERMQKQAKLSVR